MMQTGYVKAIHLGRGFGFIQPNGGSRREVFFHMSALDGLTFDETLRERRVEFVATETEKGLRAQVVKAAR